MNASQERPEFVRIVRLLSVNRDFDFMDEVFLPVSRFGSLLKTPRTQLHGAVIRYVLLKEFGTPTVRIAHDFRCGRFPAEICRALDLSRSADGMIWELFAFTRGKAPISYQRCYVPPSAHRLQIGPMTMPAVHFLDSGAEGRVTEEMFEHA